MVTQNFSFGVTHYTKLFLQIQFGRATCGAGGSLILAIASKVRATCRQHADPIFPPMRDPQEIGKPFLLPQHLTHEHFILCTKFSYFIIAAKSAIKKRSNRYLVTFYLKICIILLKKP
uniref:hypothetical protein n=1 Tax=Bacillus amyloliquefaciens TaxID=1390 RepID=UPI00155D94F9|nr:hypothetical protein [Bacillus amyloliquefaciens]